MIRPAVRWAIPVYAGVLAAAGCSEGDREECLRVDEGEFRFSVQSTPAFPVGSDSTANLTVTLQNAVIDTIIASPGFDPPIILYRLRATGYSRVDIQLDDLLLPASSNVADRGFPIRKGDTLTVFIEQTRRLNPPAMAIKFSDASGLRYLGVNDWRPSGDPGAKVLRTGYGNLGAHGELLAILADPACEDRNDDPQCYFEIRNQRLDFVAGGLGPIELHNGGDRTEGGWRFHVHKAARMVATTSCFDALLRQNAVSFFVEREGARAP